MSSNPPLPALPLPPDHAPVTEFDAAAFEKWLTDSPAQNNAVEAQVGKLTAEVAELKSMMKKLLAQLRASQSYEGCERPMKATKNKRGPYKCRHPGCPHGGRFIKRQCPCNSKPGSVADDGAQFKRAGSNGALSLNVPSAASAARTLANLF